MNVLPAYEVHKLDGFVKVRKAIYDKEAKARGEAPIRYEEVKEPAGYLIFFPAGHSIRVRDDEELVRMGFGGSALKVDMDTGEIVPEEKMTLERRAQIKNKQVPVVNLLPATENEKETA